ncbi:hypothetical protein ABDK00_001530 [Niabella insulamsoli]|uniref:hypothetical protein n=1 Tax=Niabella insulamsoli TaxID=3144874 RepID=UPI0031FD3108
MKGKGVLTRLDNAKRVFDKVVNDAEQKLADDISFPFAVIHQSGDGFCVVHQETARVALLEAVISVIDQRGYLTESDFFDHCI